MQERRATIRIGQQSRVQYCPSDDLLPRDGQLLNVGERGAGLEVREAHRCGERITVNVLLPGEEEPLTATGVVRWSDLRSPRRRRCRLGMEWLPLEDPVRHRLQRFLHTQVQRPIRRRFFDLPRSWRRRGFRASRAIWLSVVMFTPLIGVLMVLQMVALQQENRQLHLLNDQRSALLEQLGRQQARLQQELGSTKAFLAATVEEVTRLDRQAQQLEGELTQLNQDVGQARASYDQVKAEREELMQRVMELQLERTSLAHQLKTTQELRQAIVDMIKSRRLARRGVQPPPVIKPPDLLIGNRGYIIYDGRPTAAKSTMWIRVLNPATVLLPGGQAAAGATPPEGPAPSAEPSASSVGEEESVVAETVAQSAAEESAAPEAEAPSPAPADPIAPLPADAPSTPVDGAP